LLVANSIDDKIKAVFEARGNEKEVTVKDVTAFVQPLPASTATSPAGSVNVTPAGSHTNSMRRQLDMNSPMAGSPMALESPTGGIAKKKGSSDKNKKKKERREQRKERREKKKQEKREKLKRQLEELQQNSDSSDSSNRSASSDDVNSDSDSDSNSNSNSNSDNHQKTKLSKAKSFPKNA